MRGAKSLGTLWRKARYAAAEALFRLAGFVEPRFEFYATTRAIADCMDYEGTKTRTRDAIAVLRERIKAEAIGRAESARRN